MSTHILYVDFAVFIEFCIDPGETNCFHWFLHSWFSLVFAVLFVSFVTLTADKVHTGSDTLQLQWQYQIIAVYINHNT